MTIQRDEATAMIDDSPITIAVTSVLCLENCASRSRGDRLIDGELEIDCVVISIVRRISRQQVMVAAGIPWTTVCITRL